MSQQTDNNASINTEFLMLPGPGTSNDNNSTKFDIVDGKSVKLDELGPMVVNTDGVRLFVLSHRVKPLT